MTMGVVVPPRSTTPCLTLLSLALIVITTITVSPSPALALDGLNARPGWSLPPVGKKAKKHHAE